MLGFEYFDCAAITIAGVELLHRIRKSQFAVVVYGSKAKLHLRSGMQFLLHPARASRVHTPVFQTYAGSFEILSGADGLTFDTLATTGFQVNLTPEPGRCFCWRPVSACWRS